MNVTPDNITSLKPNEVFVFGSNKAGRHGKGAAKLAANKFGAVYGKDGFAGQSYGISTKDDNLAILSIEEISFEIAKFLDFAEMNPKLKFLVTKIGCGLARRTPAEIAPLFFAYDIPDNVYLPKEFWACQ